MRAILTTALETAGIICIAAAAWLAFGLAAGLAAVGVGAIVVGVVQS